MKKTQYQQGWEDAMDQAETIAEAVKQIKDWNKYEQEKFDAIDFITVMLFIGVCLGVVIMMII